MMGFYSCYKTESFARFYNLDFTVNSMMSSMMSQVDDNKSEISYLSKPKCSKISKYSFPSIGIQINLNINKKFKF